LAAPVATGDLVINNFQAATTDGAIAATATTTVSNNDSGDKDQILNSTVSASRNVTIAEGMSNTATNTATISGTSGLSATGGVLNFQANDAKVGSTATGTVGVSVGIADNGLEAVDGSTVTIANNATASRAGGNTAFNALNATALGATAAVGTPSIDVSGATSTNAVDASYAVLNQQSNTKGITSATTVGYTAAFEGGANIATDSSRVALNGNSASSVAYANSADNRLVLTALNVGDASAAIGSNQVNSAAVSATTTAVMSLAAAGSGTAATSAVNAGTMSIGGSSVNATAVGNSAVSALLRN
jgi:hypothetical protein